MRKRTVGLFLFLVLVSACSSGPEPTTSEETTTAISASTEATTTEEGFATVSAGTTFQVFVNTRFPGECNDEVNNGGFDGDCWLPAYEQPSYSANILNLNNDLASPCRQVEVSGRLDSQKGCWPQPQRSPTELADSVEVICDQELDGLEWRAFVLPKERMLVEPGEDTVFYGNEKKAVVVWNLSKFLRLPQTASDDEVPDCKF